MEGTNVNNEGLIETVPNPWADRDANVKQRYGKGIRRIVVDGFEPGEKLVAYVRYPDVQTLSQMESLLQKDVIAACDQLFNKCVIKDASDPDLFAYDELRMAVAMVIPDMLNKKKGSLQIV